MITFNNTKTIYDLVKRVGTEFENQVFVRYEKDDTIYEKGYGTYTLDTMAVAAYTERQNRTPRKMLLRIPHSPSWRTLRRWYHLPGRHPA